MTHHPMSAMRRRSRASSLAFLALGVTFITGCPGTPGATPTQTAGGVLGAGLPAAPGAAPSPGPINGLLQAALAPTAAATTAARPATPGAATTTTASPATPANVPLPRPRPDQPAAGGPQIIPGVTVPNAAGFQDLGRGLAWDANSGQYRSSTTGEPISPGDAEVLGAGGSLPVVAPPRVPGANAGDIPPIGRVG